MSLIRTLNHTILPDGVEIWHYGKYEGIVFDDEPINIFEEINEPYSNKKLTKHLSGLEWQMRFDGINYGEL